MNDRLRIENIHKEFEGKPLLNGISFQVDAGEVLCLLGQSGSGKSTLLRIIAGIEPPQSGRILWNGREMNDVPVHLRRFGLMFQDYALFPHLNVRENVSFGLRMQGMEKEEIAVKVRDALEKVNLGGFGERIVTDLSGGEQQRVALARALAPEPHLLMLDEPLAALDRALRAQLQEELRTVLHQTGIPAIYVTHDQDEALALGDRLALLHSGEIVQIGTPEEVYRCPKNVWVARFLGMENILPAKVTRLTPFTVSTDFGELEVTRPPEGRCKTGDAVFIVMLSAQATPEAEDNGKNNLLLTVVESTFRGDRYRTTLRGEKGHALVLNVQEEHSTGEKVLFHFDPLQLLCLND